jgi:hypothetical protein
VLAAALATTISMPQSVQAQPAAFRTPQFVATAVKFKALHETHYNWMGSDEVFGTFYDFTGRRVTGTSTFGDVDAGETRNIAPEQSCLSPGPRCDHGASSLGFGIALIEEDDWGFFSPGFCHGALDPGGPPPTSEDYERAFDDFHGWDCSSNDFIGKAKVKLSQDELVAALPTVGASFDRTIPLTGGDGKYEFTYRITRLPNAINIPPIGPPVVLNPIQLSAMETSVGGPKRVALTWTGASSANVDIYRDGAIIVTTPNDGSYDDPRQPGTYQYRVCDQGSTTACSADVTIIVT